MAEEGGSFKASEFFIGVVDLFAILLPGAILAFVVAQCLPWLSTPKVARMLTPPFVAYACFGVAAYVTGHFLSALGSIVMDHVYDRWYKKRFGRKLAARRVRAKAQLDRVLHILSDDNALDWTLAVLRVQAPGTLAQLDRLEADSKFFRSLALALLLSWPVIQWANSGPSAPAVTALILVGALVVSQSLAHKLHSPIRARSRLIEATHTVLFLSPILWGIAVSALSAFYAGQNNLAFAGIAFGCYALAVAAALRYMALRMKRTQIAYELLTVLVEGRMEPAKTGSATTPPAD